MSGPVRQPIPDIIYRAVFIVPYIKTFLAPSGERLLSESRVNAIVAYYGNVNVERLMFVCSVDSIVSFCDLQ